MEESLCKIILKIEYENRGINEMRTNPKKHTVTQIEEEEKTSKK